MKITLLSVITIIFVLPLSAFAQNKTVIIPLDTSDSPALRIYYATINSGGGFSNGNIASARLIGTGQYEIVLDQQPHLGCSATISRNSPIGHSRVITTANNIIVNTFDRGAVALQLESADFYFSAVCPN